MSGKFFLRKFLYRRQSVAGYVVAERDHNRPVLSGCAASSGKKPHSRPPHAAAGGGRRAAMLCRPPRACGARRADRTRRQQSAGRRGPPIPPGAAPWESGSRRRTGRAREEARSATLARPGLPAAASHESAASVGEFPLVSVYEKRAESGLREAKGKKTDWDMGRAKKRP